MKKLFVLAMAMGLSFLQAHSQDQPLKYGIKGSFTETNFYAEDVDTKFGPGYAAGLFVQYNISEAFAVSVAPAYAVKQVNNADYTYYFDKYSTKFWDMTTGEPIPYKSHNIVNTVIEVPLVANLMLNMGNLTVRPFAGPTCDFILSSSMVSTRGSSVSDNVTDEIVTSEDITDRVPYYDLGAIGGVGIDIKTDVGDISAEVYYRRGFSDLNNVEFKNALYSNTFGVSVGFSLEKLFQ